MEVNGEKSKEEDTTTQECNSSEYQGKSTAIIAYIPIFGILIALVKNKEEKSDYTSFHIRQVLGIYCVGLVLAILSFSQKIGMLSHFIGVLFVMLLWVFGMISAVNGKRKPVFILGGFFQKWFKGVK